MLTQKLPDNLMGKRKYLSIKGTACFYRFIIRKKNSAKCVSDSITKGSVSSSRKVYCVWGALLNFSKGRIITVQQTEGTAL